MIGNSNKVCPICNELLTDPIKIVGIDKPYINLGLHRDCFHDETIDDFIRNNIELIIKLCKKGK